jgi:hypothetical protein
VTGLYIHMCELAISESICNLNSSPGKTNPTRVETNQIIVVSKECAKFYCSQGEETDTGSTGTTCRSPIHSQFDVYTRVIKKHELTRVEHDASFGGLMRSPMPSKTNVRYASTGVEVILGNTRYHIPLSSVVKSIE